MPTKFLLSAATLSLLFSAPVALAADTDTSTNADTQVIFTTEDDDRTTNEDGSPRVLMSKEAAENFIIRHFLQIGAEDMHISDTLSEGIFDVGAYMNHGCFQIIGWYELQQCEEMFGEYANLRETMVSGKLGEMLARHNLSLQSDSGLVLTTNDEEDDEDVVDGTDSLAPGAFGGTVEQDLINRMADTDNTRDEETNPEEDSRDSMHERSQRVWELCGERFPGTQAACYQSNLRYVRDATIHFDDIGETIR